MQDYAIGLHENPLQWETERQNRIHQEAVEQKKKQLRPEDARKGQQFIEKVTQDLAGSNDYLANRQGLQQNLGRQSATPFDAAVDWPDKVRRIPEMRSAWIPLDETREGSNWSKPFSLPKADMEPWISFLRGYNESRLFLESSSVNRNHPINEKRELQLDFAVQAILALKGMDANVILNSPVQIDSQVEYFDLHEELRTCHDLTRTKALVKVAADTHQSQLRKAVEKGREMGNRLHDALMGEGHINLIKAWERMCKRKPTVEELHLMLTIGRVKIMERRQSGLMPREAQNHERVNPVAREASLRVPQQSIPIPKEVPFQNNRTVAVKKHEVSEEIETEQTNEPSRRRKIFLHLFQASVCCAALAILILYGEVI